MNELKKCKTCLNLCNCCKHKDVECMNCRPFGSLFQSMKLNRCNTNTKYLPGDRVVVRADLTNDAYTMSDGFTRIATVESMIDLAGKTVTISKIDNSFGNDRLAYRIQENPCYWVDEMFAGKAYDHE